MFSNVAVDVAIGIIFIILLYSLLATIFQEMIARWMGLRPRMLLRALRRMLQDGDSEIQPTLINAFIDAVNNLADYFRPIRKRTFLKAFYDHPTIKYLGENNTNSKPSYIEPSNFSQTIIQILRGNGYNQSLNQMQVIRTNLTTGVVGDFIINPNTLDALSKIWTDSANDIDRFKENLEAWFNNTMARSSGWYKRQTQFMLFLVGFLFAWQFNVDVIAIGKILSTNKDIRQQMVDMAMKKKENYEEIIKAGKDSVIVDSETKKTTIIRFVNMKDTDLARVNNSLKQDAEVTQQILGLGNRKHMDPAIKKKYQNSDEVAFVGWLITALAISLGAPFWFDLLNKFVMLRNATRSTSNNDKDNAQQPATPPIKPVG